VTAARSAPSRGGPSATGTYFRAAGSRSSLVFRRSRTAFFRRLSCVCVAVDRTGMAGESFVEPSPQITTICRRRPTPAISATAREPAGGGCDAVARVPRGTSPAHVWTVAREPRGAGSTLGSRRGLSTWSSTGQRATRGHAAVKHRVVPRGTPGARIGSAHEDPPARPPIRSSWRGHVEQREACDPSPGKRWATDGWCVPRGTAGGYLWSSAATARSPGCSTWNIRPTTALYREPCCRKTDGCSTWNSHGAQKRGRFAGTPGLRAYRSGHGSSWSSAWYRNPSVHDRPTAMPRRARPPAAQRSDESAGAPASPSSGGSLTASLPPTWRNGAPHSAVTAGGPKPRATTRSNAPRR
jgi:hypothetical protein